jgi:hypothetical protein
MMSAFGGNVLQNYFEPQSEEQLSKLRPEREILIQETTAADSIIARFRRSAAYWPTFATQSG